MATFYLSVYLVLTNYFLKSVVIFIKKRKRKSYNPNVDFPNEYLKTKRMRILQSTQLLLSCYLNFF